MTSVIQNTHLISANYSPDGSVIEFTLGNPIGEMVAFECKYAGFDLVVTRMNELALQVRRLQKQQTGHVHVTPQVSDGEDAETVVGGQSVVLSVQTGGTGGVHGFSMPPDRAEALGQKLIQAAADAREQAKRSRN